MEDGRGQPATRQCRLRRGCPEQGRAPCCSLDVRTGFLGNGEGGPWMPGSFTGLLETPQWTSTRNGRTKASSQSSLSSPPSELGGATISSPGWNREVRTSSQASTAESTVSAHGHSFIRPFASIARIVVNLCPPSLGP